MTANSSFPRSVRDTLRAATATSHEALDDEFGTLDLTVQQDFIRFLAAHYIGLSALYPVYRAYVAGDLMMPVPDYPAMLHRDLAAMGCDVTQLPVIPLTQDLDPLAVTYVLAGSRLGLTMLSRQQYWGRTAAQATLYMEDADGLAVWKSLIGRMGQLNLGEGSMASIIASANAAFLVFRQAFALSADVGAVHS